MSRLILLGVAALFAVLHGPAGACAESYPQRAVRFIRPGPAPESIHRPDARRTSCRALGKAGRGRELSGGDGIVAINVFTSAKDDHTLLFVPTSTFTAHPYTHDKLPYDPQRAATCCRSRPSRSSSSLSLLLIPQNCFARRLRGDGASPSGNAQRGCCSRQLGSRVGGIKDMNLQVKVPFATSCKRQTIWPNYELSC